MSLSYAQESQTLAAGLHDNSSVRVHILGRPLFARGLEQVFEGTGFTVSASAFFGPFQPTPEDLSVRDLFIVDGNFFCRTELLDQLVQLKALNSDARFILISDQLDAASVRALREAGVDGICLTSSSREVILRSAELVMLGEVIVSSGLLMEAISQHESCPDPEPEAASDDIFKSPARKLLSNREVEVLNWLKEGAPNKVIARHLNVAEATVKVHVKAILKKINVSNRAQAAVWAAHHMPSEVLDPRTAD
jgi:two-component system nitrate/nitrite response regulator NarL